MRYPIWKDDDFFAQGAELHRIDMDPNVVTIAAEPLPMYWNFNWGDNPVGQATDVRIEDGEITAEITFFNDGSRPQWTDQQMEDHKCRIGGYYGNVQFNSKEKTIVTACELRGVAILFEDQMPGANPGAKI